MIRARKALLPLAVVAATFASALEAATDEERIKRLEELVEQQQRTIEALGSEVKQLRSQQQATTVKVEDETPGGGDCRRTGRGRPASTVG